MKEPKSTIQNFYLERVKGRPSAETFNAILCIYALLQRKMEDYFRPSGLTPVKFNALILIKHWGTGEGISQNEICRHLIVSPSNVTRLIDRLIEDGFAMRVASLEDRRVNIIKITAKGSDILDQTWKGFAELIQQTAYVMERREVEDLSRLLLQWFAKIEGANFLGKVQSHER